MRTRWSAAPLALAVMLAAGWSAAWGADAGKARAAGPQMVTLAIPNTQ